MDLVLSHRVNYAALRAVRGRLASIFGQAAGAHTDVWSSFLAYEEERRAIRGRLGQKAHGVVGDARTVLIYSQSQRVVDCLSALSPERQRSVAVLIAECRPKSPTHFADALGVARLLEKTQYQLRLVPDVACGHLLQGGRINLVMMGAHSVFRSSDGAFRYFVNTCGSSMLAAIAQGCNIPVKVVFESEKVQVLDDSESQVAKVSFDEEENIAADVLSALALTPSLAERTRVINVGYDLVAWGPGMVAVTDLG